MNAEKLGKSRLMNLLGWIGGAAMESRLRASIFDPAATLTAAGVHGGQTVLEVGCGTGFFTLPAARMIGKNGHLTAMDPMAGYCTRVRERLEAAGLSNASVLQRDALHTGLADTSIDLVLLLGVLPYPTLPLARLLPEMHRILKPDGHMGVWLFPARAGIPEAIVRTELFSLVSQDRRTYRFAVSRP